MLSHRFSGSLARRTLGRHRLPCAPAQIVCLDLDTIHETRTMPRGAPGGTAYHGPHSRPAASVPTRVGRVHGVREWWQERIHPYATVKAARETHAHLLPTRIRMPAYSTLAIPFWWMLQQNQDHVDARVARVTLSPDDEGPVPQRVGIRPGAAGGDRGAVLRPTHGRAPRSLCSTPRAATRSARASTGWSSASGGWTRSARCSVTTSSRAARTRYGSGRSSTRSGRPAPTECLAPTTTIRGRRVIRGGPQTLGARARDRRRARAGEHRRLQLGASSPTADITRCRLNEGARGPPTRSGPTASHRDRGPSVRTGSTRRSPPCGATAGSLPGPRRGIGSSRAFVSAPR